MAVGKVVEPLDLESSPPLPVNTGFDLWGNERAAAVVVAKEMPVAASYSPHFGPRIMRLYDGERVGSMERASKRKAAGSATASSGTSAGCSPSPGGRCKKYKVTIVAGLLQLPLSGTPRPLTRGKHKHLAMCCDLNVDDILAQASSSSVRAARSSPAEDSSASSVGNDNFLNVCSAAMAASIGPRGSCPSIYCISTM